jgi:iron complex transport system substrate-binding protein
VDDLRIASLLPSATEIVYALGAGPALVARSHECDFPPGVERLPVCTSARLADGTSREIDDRVKDLVDRGLSIYEVDAEQLRALAPSVVLTQDQCEVCAASVSDVEHALASWTGTRPRLVSLAPRTLGDVLGDVVRVGAALGLEARARACASGWTDRITAIGERSGALPRPRVACIEWTDPPMAAGNWVPELVALAGGEPLLATAGSHSPWLEWDALREADPDVIVLMPCGFDLARTRRELAPLAARPGWSGLRAVRAGRVHGTDGNAFFSRPGPRLVESLEILAEILHPEVFDFGHRGRAHEIAAS